MDTLTNEQSPDFWLLNNGVTMLNSGANIFDNIITIHDVQIVNGLQTTVTILNYYQNGYLDKSNLKVLIKVINPSSPTIAKEITKATNNQSTIPLYALHTNYEETIKSLIDFINDSELKTVIKMNNRDVANRYLQKAAPQFSL